MEAKRRYLRLCRTERCGKTTTLRIISGLLKSDGGDLWLDGVRTTKNILKQKSLIGFVPDFFGVYENLSVIEYLEFLPHRMEFTGGQEPSVRGSARDGRTIGKRGADGGFALKGHTAAVALSGARDDP